MGEFNPAEHLRKLTRKRKVKENGQERWISEEHQYLDVKWRIYWFRQVYPDGCIETKEMAVTDKLARIEAAIYDKDPAAGGKCLARSRRQVLSTSFSDYTEKAETQAIGRALALAGFGTQFCDELDEGDVFSDSPVGNKSSTHNKPKEPTVQEQILTMASKKGLSADDATLLMRFKYSKDNPAELTAEEADEFIKGIKTTAKERLVAFVGKLRENVERDQVA